MGTDFSSLRSLKRASALLNTPIDNNNYIIFKLQSEPRSCCCTHCWPRTWIDINEHIHPSGPVGHEGDAVIDTGEGIYVLESHESGPEIIIYLGTITASLVLLKSIVDLILTFIKAKSKDNLKDTSRLKLSRRIISKNEITDEILIEIDLPLNKDITKLLNDKIRNELIRETEPTGSDQSEKADASSSD